MSLASARPRPLIDWPTLMSDLVELPGGAHARLYRGSVDADDLWDWSKATKDMAVDTETTGLSIYSGDVATLAILADENLAWVIPMDDPDNREQVGASLRDPERLILHNAAFDLTALDGLVADGWDRVTDLMLLSHILDSRPRHHGGIGHGLKDLAVHFFGEEWAAPESERKQFFRTNKWNETTGWKMIDPRSPEMVRYAGTDGVMTLRTFREVDSLIGDLGIDDEDLVALIDLEHRVASVAWKMQQTGFAIDQGRAAVLSEEYIDVEIEAMATAAKFGITNVNSTAQVAGALKSNGVTLSELTNSGKDKIDRAVLDRVMAAGGVGADIATSVSQAKRAAHFRKDYVNKIVDGLDEQGRIHPNIRTLAAITGRMSISDPPLQQLPKNDPRVRSMFVADPGQVLLSVDYSQVELRVLAAYAGETQMIEAIANGEDLHSLAAEKVFGSVTPANRKYAKIIGLGKVYGGGAETLARQAGADVALVQEMIDTYDARFPQLVAFNDLASNHVRKLRSIQNDAGRVMKVEQRYAFRSVNYLVQSTARDIFARALVRLDCVTPSDYCLLLPVHDEVVAQCPQHLADQQKEQIVEIMGTTFKGVPITAEGEILGERWGKLSGEG